MTKSLRALLGSDYLDWTKTTCDALVDVAEAAEKWSESDRTLEAVCERSVMDESVTEEHESAARDDVDKTRGVLDAAPARLRAAAGEETK